jgi:hypothetical protein
MHLAHPTPSNSPLPSIAPPALRLRPPRTRDHSKQLLRAAIPVASVFLPLAGLLVAVTPQAAFRDAPRAIVLWGTFAILGVLAFAGYHAAKMAGQSPWISPVSLITIYYFFRYGIGALVVEYTEVFPWRAYPHFRWSSHRFGVWQYLPGGCQLMIVFGIGLLAGSLLALSGRSSILPRFSWRMNVKRLQRSILVSTPVAAVLNVLQFGLPDSIRFVVGLFGSFVYPAITLGAFWLFTADNAKDRARWIIFLIACCGLSLPSGLISGQMATMLLPCASIALGYIVAKGAPPWRAIAIMLPLVLLILLPLTALYKISGATESDLGRRVENTLKTFSATGYQGRFELALERSVMRFSGAFMPSLYAQFYPNVYSFEYGRSFGIEGSSLVPRVLWPDKPIIAAELNKYPARIGIVAYEGNTTAIFDAVSEYYLNFGMIGLFVLAVAHGYYWQAMYRWLVTRVDPLLGAVLMLVLIIQNEDFYGIGLLFSSQVKILPAYLILFHLCSRSGSPSRQRA